MVFVDDKAAAINALIEAVEAIEEELGITPSGVYADVRVRLDILEARINNPLAPAPNVENPFFIGDDGVTISVGFGYPTENRLPGSLYLREDGYSNEGVYARRPDGYWHLIDTDPFTANGDLSGSLYTQTVIGLQNRPVSPSAPQTDSKGDGYILTWNNIANWWEPQIGFFPAGDLDGYKTTQTVVKLQGTSIVIGTMGPTKDGYVLTWNNTVPRWEPQRLAVVFDPLDNGTTTNIRSNRYSTQSPILGGVLGAVNFGNRSVGLSLGVQANYSSILGGDGHEVNSDYSVVVGGDSNVISTGADGSFIGGGFSNTVVANGLVGAIVNGDSNIINASAHAFIGNGFGNSISADASGIVNGNNNTISGMESFIGSGNTNSVLSALSSIVGGNSNSIALGANFGFIGGGQLNNILVGVNSSIVGGSSQTIHASNASIVSGDSNTINGSGSFVDILGGSQNTITSTAGAFLTILGGAQHSLNGTFNTITNGSFLTVTVGSSYSNMMNGFSNQIDGYYNTILSGTSNSITGTNSVIFNGSTNVVQANYILVGGTNNNINSGSDYSFVNGNSNTTNSNYLSIFGLSNSLLAGSTYARVSGNNNTVGNSAYISIQGAGNTVVAGDGYSTILGANNTLAANAANSFIKGNTNQITGLGSGIFGSSNTLFGDESYIFGNSGSLGTLSVPANRSFIFGDAGKALYTGQHVQSVRSINGTVGASQYSRVILDGYQVSGGQFDLVTFGDGYLTLENGKSYDMCVRILVTNTTGSPTCARYVYDVLAHCEAGTLTLDVVNATILNDNGTGWTVSLLASTNQLVVQVDSSGVLNRRAIATVEWREISRT